MQQCLPLAVLKRQCDRSILTTNTLHIATVLTACGIETVMNRVAQELGYKIATVLTACGIETHESWKRIRTRWPIATVLTACGIET